jgi:signal transduction histidine kinase
MESRSTDSTDMLRLAGWIWVGYLLALCSVDFIIYRLPGLPRLPFFPLRPPLIPGTPFNDSNPSLFPVFLYYVSNGIVALGFLMLSYWEKLRSWMGRYFYPLAVLAISTVPIIINILIVPRFPPGPLANAEGMSLRQLPVLFLALALIAWEYPLPYTIFFSIATTGLELSLVTLVSIGTRNTPVIVFIAVIRTISFIALGVFINLLVKRLHDQQASLRRANKKLAGYASTTEQLAISRERNRLARDLHDTLAHSLTALSIALETARAFFDVDPAKTRMLLDQSLKSAREGIRETRRTLKDLRSSALEDLGLVEGIRRLAISAADRAKLKLALDLPATHFSLRSDIEEGVYRIAQEAIENTVHHANASTLAVSLTNNGSGATLTVADNGKGFKNNEQSQPGHYGLIGMRERAELIGARISIESDRTDGTRVVLKL